MKNEILLVFSILVCYGSVLLMFRFFKEQGLYAWTVIATISANIEVLILIKAFGIEQTLGNVLFASNFLVTDIFSEVYGKKKAIKAVYISCASSILFIMLSQYWLQYTPSPNDWVFPAMKSVFSVTPRVMLAGLLAYAISQSFDVWAYHKWWSYTQKRSGSKEKFLWLRNNASTLLSQLINTILFTWGAFWKIYPDSVLLTISISSYLLYIITSLADTPFVYWARKISEKLNETKTHNNN